MSEQENQSYLHSNPEARTRFLVVVLFAALFVALLMWLIYSMDTTVMAWLEQNIQFIVAHPELVFLAGLLLVSPLLWGASYLFRYGSRAIQQKRFPPTGYALIRKVQIYEGPGAVRRGRFIQFISAFIFISAFMIPVFLAGLFVLLGTVE